MTQIYADKYKGIRENQRHLRSISFLVQAWSGWEIKLHYNYRRSRV